jgi:hypothetical protein
MIFFVGAQHAAPYLGNQAPRRAILLVTVEESTEQSELLTRHKSKARV